MEEEEKKITSILDLKKLLCEKAGVSIQEVDNYLDGFSTSNEYVYTARKSPNARTLEYIERSSILTSPSYGTNVQIRPAMFPLDYINEEDISMKDFNKGEPNMGQYFKAVNNTKCEHMFASSFNSFIKMMEHSYVGNTFVETVMHLLGSEDHWKYTNLVWAGDYAEEDECTEEYKHLIPSLKKKHDTRTMNLYSLSDCIYKDTGEQYRRELKTLKDYKYIANDTKKEFVEISKCPYNQGVEQIHPLPILTSIGNGKGGGDYIPKGKSHDEYIGRWANDIIFATSNEKELTGFTEIMPDFD